MVRAALFVLLISSVLSPVARHEGGVPRGVPCATATPVDYTEASLPSSNYLFALLYRIDIFLQVAEQSPCVQAMSEQVMFGCASHPWTPQP